jgi:hypothetical protein
MRVRPAACASALAAVFALSLTMVCSPNAVDDCRDYDRVSYTRIQEPFRVERGDGIATEVSVYALPSDAVLTADLQ